MHIHVYETSSTHTFDRGGTFMARPSNFKGQVIVQGGESRKLVGSNTAEVGKEESRPVETARSSFHWTHSNP